MLRILLVLLVACLPALAAKPVPVILDTDLGDDIDDTWALAMLLKNPKVDLQLIVTASDNTPVKTRLVAKILEHMGHTEIPLGMGKQTSENPIHQADWLGDYALKDFKGTVHEDGVQAMIDHLRAAKSPMVLCVIGPQTNIAEALRRAPDIAQKARVVSMAGSVHIGYDGKPGAAPEWNVLHDVDSARAVFAAPWDITIAPLDTCGTLRLSGARYGKVAASKSPLAKVTMDNYAQWSNRKHYAVDASSVLYDTLATYLCYTEKAVRMDTVKLRIDDSGAMAIDAEHGRPVRCALEWKDRDAFEKHLVKQLTR